MFQQKMDSFLFTFNENKISTWDAFNVLTTDVGSDILSDYFCFTQCNNDFYKDLE